MSISTSQRQDYDHSLRGALTQFKRLAALTEWTLLKTEDVQQHEIQVWRHKNAVKVVMKHNKTGNMVASQNAIFCWSLHDWRSLLETDGAPGVNHMVEKRQVITRLDKHTRVSDVKMKKEWELGPHDRTLVEQVVQHPTSLRYIAAAARQDDQLQSVCLDIHHPANQPNQPSHVTLYYQWAPSNSSITDTSTSCDAMSEKVSAYATSIIHDYQAALSSSSSSGLPPFISRQDMRIQLDHNTYDPRTRTLDIKYHCNTSNTNTIDDVPHQSPATPTMAVSPNINIQRHASLHSSTTQSRSWDPAQEPVLPSSLRRHDFMSSSLVFRSSSPGSGGHRLPPINVTKRLSTIDLSSSYSSVSSTSSSKAARPSSPLSSAKGEQLVIDIGADNNKDNTLAHLTIQLLDSDKELGPTLNNQFAQLCLRCVKCYPSDAVNSASRYSLILHHPESLMDDLKLPQDTTRLTVRLVLVLQNGSDVNGPTAPSGNLQLLLDGKQWPIRNTMPWEVAIDESDDQEDDDDAWDGKPMNDDIDTDPFMDSMEDVHDSTPTPPVSQQINQVPVSQISPLPIAPAKRALDSDTSTVNPSEIDNRPPLNALTQDKQQQPKSKSQKPKDIIVDDIKAPSTVAALSQQRPPSSGKKIQVPHVDPSELTKAYQYFDALLHSNDWHVTQKPDQNNGFATIMKMDVEGHPTGVLMCETVWQHCSIWDAKAVLSCSEAREIWDSMFEKSEHICSVTPSCSIWHSKVKSAWPASPRDYVAFTAQYTSSQRVDICSTSCIGDTYEHYALPKETSDFVRATLDLSGWRLDAIDNSSTTTSAKKKPSTPSFAVSVRYVLQTHFQGWIPWYLLNQLTTQAPNVPTSAYQYLKKHGAPPCVEALVMATMQQQRYDHMKKNWRVEYTRSITTGDLGPTKVTVRLDRRRWAYYSSSSNSGGSHYNITIDPPPSNVSAEARDEDPYGVWLVIEHDESFIIPRRGKILVLIKPGKSHQNHHPGQLHKKKRLSPVTLLINGTTTSIQNDAATMDLLDDHLEESNVPTTTGSTPPSSPDTSSAATVSTPSPLQPSTTTSPSNDDDDKEGLERDIQKLVVSPMEQAQGALLYMKRMDEPFGWTVVSDKQGLRINKRSGTKSSSSSSSSSSSTITSTTATAKAKSKLATSAPSAKSGTSSSSPSQQDSGQVSRENEGTKAPKSSPDTYYLDVADPCVIYKASKVIENFSTEEVASVVTNISQARIAYDASLEKCELIKPIQRGCQVIRQEIKGIFPFKSRELYLTSCTAIEKTLGPSASKRILYVESSLDLPTSKSSKLPRGKMFVSGWILESIDPYTTATNHPIPSMRATYMIALDLGSSIPSYLSNLCASGIVAKKIQWVEQYLKRNGPLPYLVHPLPVVGLRKNKCLDIQLLLDDENANDYATDSNSSSNNSTTNTTMDDGSRTIYPLSTSRMTTLRWVDIQAIYGQQPLFMVKSQCQYQQPPPPTTPRSSILLSALETSSPYPEQSSSLSSIQPTASQSASRMDRRHSLISSTHSTQSHRRGSMPPGSPSSSSSLIAAAAAAAASLETSTKQYNLDQKDSIRPSLASPSSSSNMMVDPVLCEVIVDLQVFSQGYDVMVQFQQHQDYSDSNSDFHGYNETDLSGLLSVTISELTPTPSHLLMEALDGSTAPPGKHAVQIKLVASLLSQTTLFQPKDMDLFDLNLTLQHHQPVVTKMPKAVTTATNTTSKSKDGASGKDRLTMSDILGDDDEEEGGAKKANPGAGSTSRWQGVVFVDGQLVSKYGEEIKISSKRKPTVSPVDARKEVSFSPLSTNDHHDGGRKLHSIRGLIEHHKQTEDRGDDVDQASIDSSLSSTSMNTIDAPAAAESSKGLYLGGSVVNAALGGVNDFRMRWMFPFRNSIQPPSSPSKTELDSPGSHNTNRNGTQTIEETDKKDIVSTTVGNTTTAPDILSDSSRAISPPLQEQQYTLLWTWRMLISFALVCLCLLCMIALVLLQPRLVTFDPRHSVYSLCRVSWFGGWQIQLVASQSSSFTVASS